MIKTLGRGMSKFISLGEIAPQVPKLAVLHEDQDCIVVNKPPLMLSVPGRTDVIREPRHVEWTRAVELAAASYPADGNVESRGLLQALSGVGNVPRKRRSFNLWIKKNYKVTDMSILDDIWDCISVADNDYHKPKVTSLDPTRISVAEVLEAYCGKVYAVHRLDCETSGALLFAKTEASAGELGRQFQSRVVSTDLCMFTLCDVEVV